MQDSYQGQGAATVGKANPRPQPRVVEAKSEPEVAPIELEAARRLRRPKRRRRRINRRLVALIGVIALLVAVFGGYGLSRSALFDLDRVEISGNQHTPSSQIDEVSGLTRRQAMTDLRLDIARDAIEALPWIDRAELTRRWPGTVAIRVVERTPVAVVTGDGASAGVVDRGGRVVTKVGDGREFAGLAPIVIADEVVEVGRIQPDLSSLLAVATALPAELRPWVVNISQDSRGQPQLILRDSAQVVLGDLTQLPGKFIDLATVLTRVELNDICRINLSAVHTPTVVRRPNC